MQAQCKDSTAAQPSGGSATDDIDVRTIYQQLLDIARVHGRDEIKHLTRAYQAIAPQGGGQVEQLSRLVD